MNRTAKLIGALCFGTITIIGVSRPAQAAMPRYCATLSPKPPVVGQRNHVKNVIWRNMQANCQYAQLLAQQQQRQK
jgi:hypothetical protein